MDYHAYYQQTVYPKIDFRIVNKYPHVSLVEQKKTTPLSQLQMVMLVALTGTGKTTTLDALKQLNENDIEQGMSIIPSRREVADWIAIPTAQILFDEPIKPVTDRVQRFHYTGTFAKHVKGGMATAFSWVNINKEYDGLIISEGIRGSTEITHALTHFQNWYIIELALHPITRLKRLSSRKGGFDKVSEAGDVSFLPQDLQTEAQALLTAGDITEQALAITKAESENYGLYPFAAGEQFDNYYRVDVDDKTPEQVAQDVNRIMKGLMNADD